MFCIRCGTQVAEGSSFCTNCGAPIEPLPEQPAAPVMPAEDYPVAPVAPIGGYDTAPVQGFAPTADELLPTEPDTPILPDFPYPNTTVPASEGLTELMEPVTNTAATPEPMFATDTSHADSTRFGAESPFQTDSMPASAYTPEAAAPEPSPSYITAASYGDTVTPDEVVQAADDFQTGTPRVASSPASKGSPAKIVIPIVIVALLAALVGAGFATNWFGLGKGGGSSASSASASASADAAASADSSADGAAASTDATEATDSSDAAAEDGEASADGAEAGKPEDASPIAAQLADVEAKATTNDYSWDELKSIANAIALAENEEAALEIAKAYNLCTAEGKLDGTQAKTIKLADGTETSAMIIGFAHDDRADGTGKAGISFQFSDVVAQHAFNESGNNEGGWQGSDLRQWMNDELIGLLPSELQASIVEVSKLTNNVGKTQDTSSITSTRDKLWALSLSEVEGDCDPSGYNKDSEYLVALYSSEGMQYQLFSDVNVQQKGKNAILTKTRNSKASTWWERTPAASGTSHCFYADGNGVPRNGKEANAAFGVAPGFSL